MLSVLNGVEIRDRLWRYLDRARRKEGLTPSEAFDAAIAAQHAGLWRDAREFAQRWADPTEHLEDGPLVSIVVPTFNRPELLNRALESIAAQLYRSIEAIVVNDAGERVDHVVKRFEGRLPIRLIDHEQNRYLAAARNTGLSAARGAYVGYLDDDDQLYPHHVGHLMRLIAARHARAARAGCFVQRPSESGHGGDFWQEHPWRPFELNALLEENVTPVQCLLHARELVEKIGTFDTTLRVNEDWDFWIRLRAATEVAESRVITSCVDATRETRMSRDAHAQFVAAHRAIHQRYEPLLEAIGGEALRLKQEQFRAQLEARPDRQKERDAIPEPATIVLGYHRVLPESGDDPFRLVVTQRQFEAQLDALAERYRFVSADQFLEGAPSWDRRPRLLLTFDDGYRDFYQYAWPILCKREIPAVLFVTTGCLEGGLPFWWELLHAVGATELQQEWRTLPPDERRERMTPLLARLAPEQRRALGEQSCSWEMLREMQASGLVEIGAHTRYHSSLGQLGRREIDAEVNGSIRDIERRLGRRPRLFAFPHGGPSDINETALELLQEAGIKAAFTTTRGIVDATRRRWGTRTALNLPRVVMGEADPAELQARIDAAVKVEARVGSPRVTILSGISAHNLGDDAMLISTVRALQRRLPNAALTVLAEEPESCGPVAAEIGVPVERSLQRYVATERMGDDPVMAVLATAKRLLTAPREQRATLVPERYRDGLEALMNADAVIDCGGANLSAHWKSYFYEKCLDYFLAKKPLYITGQQVDRLEQRDDEVLLQKALAAATAITVRENGSARYLAALGVTRLSTTGDDALDLEPAPPARIAALLRSEQVPLGQPYLAFQYRHYLDHGDEASIGYFAACIDAAIATTQLPVIGVPMHFAGTDEREHLERIAARVAHRAQFIVLHDRLTPGEAKGLFAHARAAFGISYHSALFALSSGTPYLGLYRGAHYEQKMCGLAELFEYPELPLPIDSTTPDRFAQALRAAIADRSAIALRLKRCAERMRSAVGAVLDRFVHDLAPTPTPVASPAASSEQCREPPNSERPRHTHGIDWGSLRTMQPISRKWGFDRGTPIDRVYIERFLERHRRRLHGVAMEVMNDDYLRRYGSGITEAVVLDIDPANPRADLIADLTVSGSLPHCRFDAIVLTQTLPYLFDCGTALGECYSALKPGGALLVTVPSIIKVSREPEDHWRFTEDSLKRLIETYCPDATVELESHGNLVAAIAFLTGMAAEDLDPSELEHDDPAYPVSVAALIVKGEG